MPQPPTRADLETFLRWIHAEEVLLFASDYPHWDWDEPAAFLQGFDPELRARILSGTARELYARL